MRLNVRNSVVFQIFNFLVERAEDGHLLFPLRTDVEEAEQISEEICQAVGLPVPKKNVLERTYSTDSNGNSFLLDFSEFVKLISRRVDIHDDLTVVSQGIAEVHGHIVSDVVRKVVFHVVLL